LKEILKMTLLINK